MTEPPAVRRAFGPDYREELTLRDGTRAVLRPIRPEDKAQLLAGFERLSPQSRYLRFFTDKERLTDAELRYLTEVDGEDHFALGAGLLDEHGREGQGVGIGRFVRLAGEPQVAEPALAVVDDMQGQGLGRVLLLRLVAAAAERGVRSFRCDLLAANRGMKDLLEDVSPDIHYEADGPVMTAEFRLPSVGADEPPERAEQVGPMFEWFKLAAGQVMEMRHAFEEYGDQLRDRWSRLQDEVRRGAWGVEEDAD